MAPAPCTLVVVPTLNEATHLEQVVQALLQPPRPAGRLRLAIVDGGSTDATVGSPGTELEFAL